MINYICCQKRMFLEFKRRLHYSCSTCRGSKIWWLDWSPLLRSGGLCSSGKIGQAPLGIRPLLFHCLARLCMWLRPWVGVGPGACGVSASSLLGILALGLDVLEADWCIGVGDGSILSFLFFHFIALWFGLACPLAGASF